MFILTTISDLIQISPTEFSKPSIQFLEDGINKKYANKVIQKIGLCIVLYDILKTSEGLIGHGTGVVNINVEFRLVVFRPFKGEILQGRIRSSSPQGIRLTMDFFDDIFVPPINLFEGSYYNVQEGCYTWTTADGNELFFDNNEIVRFRVEAETWVDVSPERQIPGQGEMEKAKKVPYSITASMQQSGLGPTLWW